MKKSNKALKIIAISTGASIALGVCGFINNSKINNRKNELLETGVAVTTSDDTLASIWSKKKDGIAIINVGNSKVTNTNFQQYKLSYLKEKDVDTAIIINCNTDDIAGIYQDIDYVKNVLKENDINLPVYMNINYIMENVNLNNARKEELISAFLEKCSSNGIYVGVSGTDTNLCRLKQYIFPGIQEYDALVEMEDENIKYTGPYNMVKTNDDYYVLKNDLSKIIKEKKLNEAEKFEKDAKYTYTNNEEFENYLFECGLSKSELKKYNNALFFKEGDILKIPTIIATSDQSKNIIGFKKTDKPIMGCDISYNQDDGDWDKLSDIMDFVIIRSSSGIEKDENFSKYYKKCIDYNIPVGIYSIVNYTNIGCPTLDEFKTYQSKASSKTLELLKNKKITLPVYLDIENPYTGDSIYASKSVKELFPKEYVKFMLDDWYEKMEKSGYIPGIYANKSTFDYLSTCVDYELSDKFQIWVAGSETKFIVEDDYTSYKLEDGFVNYMGATNHQVTERATGTGIKNSRGWVDLNFATVDYTKPIYSDSNQIQNEEEEKKNYRFSPDGAIALAALGAAGGSGIAYKKLRRKK